MRYIGLFFLILISCAQWKFSSTYFYEKPVGSWNHHPYPYLPVDYFSSGPGGELSLGFGYPVAFKFIGKYTSFSTKQYEDYLRKEEGISDTLSAHLFTLLMGAEFTMTPLKWLNPSIDLGIGYFSPSGHEKYRIEDSLYSHPLTFLKKMVGASIGIGLGIPIKRYYRIIPSFRYTLSPCVEYHLYNIKLLSLLEFGLGVEVSFAKVSRERELEKEIALRLQEKLNKTSNSYFEQGLSLYGMQKYNDAINSFDLALVFNPDNDKAEEWIVTTERAKKDAMVNSFIEEAKRYYQRGELIQASDKVSKALSIDSLNMVALQLKKEIDSVYTQKLSIAKEEIRKHITKGKRFYLKGNYRRAIEEWSEALEKNPGNKELVSQLGVIKKELRGKIEKRMRLIERYKREEKWGRVLKHCRWILSQQPDNVEAKEARRVALASLKEKRERVLNRALKDYKEGRYLKAEKGFKEVLSMDPKNYQAKRYLKRIGKAKVERKDETDLYFKGIQAYTQGDYETAIFYWEKVLAINPENRNAKKNIERARRRLERIKEEG